MRNFGAESVTHYVVPMNLAMFIHIFCSSLVMALFPMLNEMLNDPTRLRKVYEVVTKVIMCVAAFSALSAFAIGERFLQVWIGIDFAQAAHRVLLVHIVAFSLLALVTVAWQVAESFRAASMNSIATIIWTIAAVPFMIMLSDRIGFEGVAYGRAVGVLAYVVLMILVERKFIERSSENFWIRSLLRVVIAAVAAVGVEFVLVEQLGITWLAVIASLVAGAVTFAAAIVLLRLFDENERSMFLRAIGR
jgi:O-antigen/teichoic acid export membrane protein